MTPPRLIQDLVVDVHDARFYRRYGEVSYFKSHLCPQPNYRRVVHLLRDGRDVLVSYRHYLSAVQRREVTYHELVGPQARVWPCKWHEHTHAWLANPFGAEILQLRYEDLWYEPVACLRRLCEFAGLDRDDECLRRTALSARFASLQRQEKRFGDVAPVKGVAFFRRGIVGSYRDELPGSFRDEFVAEAGQVLRRCGYVTCDEALSTGNAVTSLAGDKARGRSANDTAAVLKIPA